MAKLNEYLGTLVSNISDARFLADVESARLALLYAEDSILKHFSIPRMKIEDVELTIPIAIDDMELEKIERTKPAIDSNKLTSIAYTEILNALKIQSFPMEFSREIRAEISRESARISDEITKANIDKLIKEFSVNIASIIESKIDILIKNQIISPDVIRDKKTVLNQLMASISKQAKAIANFEPTKEQLSNLNVTFETNRLKEKNPNTLVIIKMKISEESMEWERYEDNEGNIVTKLLPS